MTDKGLDAFRGILNGAMIGGAVWLALVLLFWSV